VNEGSARPTPPGAIWYAVAEAILLTGWGPIFMFLVLPVGSPEGVHLGARFRPDTTITVSLRAGDRLAIHAGTTGIYRLRCHKPTVIPAEPRT
jgi:hypothetical protein